MYLPPPGLLLMMPLDSKTLKASRKEPLLIDNLSASSLSGGSLSPGFNSLLLTKSIICSIALSYKRTGVISLNSTFASFYYVIGLLGDPIYYFKYTTQCVKNPSFFKNFFEYFLKRLEVI